jgi:hypothetical protein
MTTSSRTISLSQLRTALHCGYAWRLRYERGHLPRSSAAAWYGALAHATIRLAYRGLPLEQAHRQIWTRACGAALPLLDEFVALQAEYAAQGKPITKAAQRWRERNPRFDEVQRNIATYRDTTLSHLRWGKETTLADYYRRAVALLDHEPDLLLPNPILVEGQAPGTLDDEVLAVGDDMALDEDNTGDTGHGEYTLLHGTIGGVAMVGVPDIVALHTDGETIRVADYKTGRPISREELAEDAQLAIYVTMLRQNGYIEPDQPVEIGHIYLAESGPSQVWVDTSRLERVLTRLHAQVVQTVALLDAGMCIPRKGIAAGFMSPCTLCDFAHVCDA